MSALVVHYKPRFIGCFFGKSIADSLQYCSSKSLASARQPFSCRSSVLAFPDVLVDVGINGVNQWCRFGAASILWVHLPPVNHGAFI